MEISEVAAIVLKKQKEARKLKREKFVFKPPTSELGWAELRKKCTLMI